MKLRILTLEYNLASKELSMNIMDEQDPENDFTIELDTNRAAIFKQGVKITEDNHQIGAAAWTHKTVLAAVWDRLRPILSKQDGGDTQLESLSKVAETILSILETSQNKWADYNKDGLLKDRYDAYAHKENGIEYARKAGILIRDAQRSEYPPSEEEAAPLLMKLERAMELIETEIDTTTKETKATLTTEIQKLTKDINQKCARASKLADGAEEKATSALSKAENIEFKLITDLLSEEGALKKKITEMEGEIEEILLNVREEQTTKNAEIEALLARSGRTERQLARLTQKEAADAMTRQFKSAASDAAGSASNWTMGFFLVGAISVSCLIWLIQSAPSPSLTGEMGWLSIFGRLSLTAAMAYILGYTGLQATRQRNANLYFKRMGIEMVALDAYLSPYDDDVALEIKSELMQAYFGKVSAPGYQKESTLPSLDILGKVTEAIARKKEKDDENTNKAAELDVVIRKLLAKKGVDSTDLALKLLGLEEKEEAPKDDTTKEST